MSMLKSILFPVLVSFIIAVNAYAQEKLLFAIDIIRHGDRTPLITIPTIPFHWAEGLGQLTPSGMSQSYQLGQRLRNKYVNQAHLLPARYNAETIYIQSTDLNRTIMSAEACLLGLYPLGTGPSLPKTKIPALPGFYQPIPVHTLPQDQDRLLRVDSNKKTLNALLHQYVYSTPEWMLTDGKLQPKYAHWSEATGLIITHANQLILLADALFINQRYHIAAPQGLSEQDVKDIIQAGRWMFITTFKNRALAVGLNRFLFQTIADTLQQARKQEKPLKCILFFSHDAVISNIITLLGATLDDIPRYASDLNFSLVKKGKQHYYVKVTLNEQPIRIPGCQINVCTLEQFVRMANTMRQESLAIGLQHEPHD